jgi:HAD superfamily hydrolase (TIGR01509 family)
MDGTLVDTEPYWLTAEEELIAAWGGVWTREDGLQLVGSGLERSALIFQSRGVDLSVAEIIGLLTDRVMAQISESVPWRPGVRELLLELKAAGIPMAVVTMSVRRMAEHVVNSLGFDAFDTIVSGDEVAEPKPHPDPYLTAALRLGVDPRHCIAIEDSEPGVASAVAAGATTIAVPLHIPLPPSPAYALWNGLDGVTLADLVRVHASEVRA